MQPLRTILCNPENKGYSYKDKVGIYFNVVRLLLYFPFYVLRKRMLGQK